jgi:hypothetical protein
MSKTDSTKDSVTLLSVEKIIDLVRSVRNGLIKDLLNDDHLSALYYARHNKALSSVKREFLKRELNELLIAPVDLVHYAGLINHLKQVGVASIRENDFEYFHK